MIPRDPKFGGDVVYETFDVLSKAYADGGSIRRTSSPESLGAESGTRPVRKYFEAHSENLSAVPENPPGAVRLRRMIRPPSWRPSRNPADRERYTGVRSGPVLHAPREPLRDRPSLIVLA